MDPSTAPNGIFLYPLAKEYEADENDDIMRYTDDYEEKEHQSNISSNKLSPSSVSKSKKSPKKSRAKGSDLLPDELEQKEAKSQMKGNPWLYIKPLVSFGSVSSKRSNQKGPLYPHVQKESTTDRRKESAYRRSLNDSRDQVEALREIADPPGARAYGSNPVNTEVRDTTSFEIEVVQRHSSQKPLPEWEYVDTNKKDTFKAQSGCYGCATDLLDRVLEDEGNDDIRTVATLETMFGNDDKQLPVDERVHDVLMLVGGCVNTFLPEPSEKTKDVGASVLKLAIDISEAKFL